MRFFSRTENPNAVVGIFMLILLAILAGPGTLPRLFNAVPTFDEGVPCDWLRKGTDRANHQSLLAREISERTEPPIGLEVRTGSLPISPEGTFEITIVITNRTLAPVPLLITSDELILAPNVPQNGVGVVFNSSEPVTNVGENVAGAYPEDRIRILGPRQICVHQVQVPFAQIPASSALVSSDATIKAFYRNNNRGDIPLEDPNQPYTDQGLWVGVVESQSRRIGAASGQ